MPGRIQLWLVLGMLTSLALGLTLDPVPAAQEDAYLIGAYRVTHPEFLRHDWTFGSSSARTFLFDRVAGLPMAVLPLEVVGWALRIGCWILILAALLRLGRHYGLSPTLSGAAITAWLAIDQTLVAQEVIIGRVGPNILAYVFGFHALSWMLAGKRTLGALSLGLCVGFHPSVGLPFALGIGWGLLRQGGSVRSLAAVSGLALVAALPGILPLLPSLSQAAAVGRAEWRFQALARMWIHLDLLSFSHTSLLAVALAFGFTWLAQRSRRSDPSMRLLQGFVEGIAVVFVFGVVATLIRWYEWLSIYPFRVLPVVVPLLFFFTLLRSYADGELSPRRPGLALVAFVTLLCMPIPTLRLRGRIERSLAAWRVRSSDLSQALRWVAGNTPEDATILVTPLPLWTSYVSQRAQIVQWAYAPFERLPEWRERIEALVGPVAPREPVAAKEARFDRLTPEAIRGIAARYGGDYLVTRGRYDFPAVFQRGAYRVYALSRQVPLTGEGLDSARTRSSHSASRSAASGGR